MNENKYHIGNLQREVANVVGEADRQAIRGEIIGYARVLLDILSIPGTNNVEPMMYATRNRMARALVKLDLSDSLFEVRTGGPQP